jgi:hypothetical protein
MIVEPVKDLLFPVFEIEPGTKNEADEKYNQGSFLNQLGVKIKAGYFQDEKMNIGA